MGYQGRLGNFFWRFEKISFLILESLKVRVGRNLKGHLTQPPIWCLNHLSRVLAKWSLLNYFMIFSRRLQNLLQWSVTEFPILSLQCWTCMVSGSVMWHTFCFLAIYKFNTPAFCVSFVCLRKVSGLPNPGVWHVETTRQAHVFINHLPLVLSSELPAPWHTDSAHISPFWS